MKISVMINLNLSLMLLGYFLNLIGKKFKLRQYILLMGKLCCLTNLVVSLFLVSELHTFYIEKYLTEDAKIITNTGSFIVMRSDLTLGRLTAEKYYICETKECD